MSIEQPPIDNSSSDATLINAETAVTHIDMHLLPESTPASKQPTSIDIGDTIKNRFVLDNLLGKGGMGSVYRALDLRKKEAGDNKPYIALKLLGDDFKHHPHALITLQREARKTQELAHPNIVTVYDFDRDGDLIYLTMEELKGKSLDELLADSKITLSLKQKLDILQQIAQGLAYAHSKGIVHSDLKPANIFITDKNIVKILDFGIARAANTDIYEDHFDAGKLGAVTFAYGSLEMLNFEPPHTSDDIYALGIIACELIGKEHPYQRQNAQQVLLDAISPKIPALTNPLLRKLLQHSIAIRRINRIQHADDFLKKLKFARKGIKTTIGIAVTGALALTANFIYWQYFASHDIKFSDLPIAAQQEFNAHIKEAETAMSFEDLQGAVVSIDQAYKIHQSQKELIKLRNRVVTIISTNLATANTELEREFYQQQLNQLKAYPAFSKITE
ncbi:MAG TPA: serine/threonine-protein kinase [Cellvibrio sp.]|nr:serine/threonine-protein kinase [Cellvibrio sp.]